MSKLYSGNPKNEHWNTWTVWFPDKMNSGNQMVRAFKLFVGTAWCRSITGPQFDWSTTDLCNLGPVKKRSIDRLDQNGDCTQFYCCNLIFKCPWPSKIARFFGSTLGTVRIQKPYIQLLEPFNFQNNWLSVIEMLLAIGIQIQSSIRTQS
jgi:hypothetical protein